MQQRFTDRVAVVTGGAAGIGLATVRRFVAEGARVVVGDLDDARLAAVTDELGASVRTVHADVTVEDDVAALAATAVDAFGRLDVAFANAGIGDLTPIRALDPARWMRVVEVNLLGPALTVKHAAAHMPDGGAIVITASLNAVQPALAMSAYCTAKAGAARLAKVAAMELGPQGIRVNAVGPGLVQTDLTGAMWSIPGAVEDFAENAPLGIGVTPDDIAATVAFLASDDARMISGHLHLVDGAAHTMRYPDLPGHVAAAFGSPPA